MQFQYADIIDAQHGILTDAISECLIVCKDVKGNQTDSSEIASQ